MDTAIYDLNLIQYATYNKTFTFTDDSNTAIDLSGYTANLVLRDSQAGSSTYLTLTETDGLTLGSDGTMLVSIAASTTSTLTSNKYWYYCELTTGTTVSRVLQGDVYNELR